MDLSDELRQGLNTVLSEATFLGISFDEARAQCRVSLQALSLPDENRERAVTLLLSGVGRVAASLRRQQWDDDGPVVLPLQIDQLDDAVHSFGGGALHGSEFVDAPESSWSLWSELLSFDTTLSDGPTPHLLELSQEEGTEPRELDMRVWFDGITAVDPAGAEIDLQTLIDRGVRWWTAHDAGDPRTINLEVVPQL